MVEIVFVGFNTTAENDVALREIAAARRINRTDVLNEAVAAFLAAQGTSCLTIDGVLNNTVDDLLNGHLTPLEAKTAISLAVNRACREQRNASESEWSGSNDSD